MDSVSDRPTDRPSSLSTGWLRWLGWSGQLWRNWGILPHYTTYIRNLFLNQVDYGDLFDSSFCLESNLTGEKCCQLSLLSRAIPINRSNLLHKNPLLKICPKFSIIRSPRSTTYLHSYVRIHYERQILTRIFPWARPFSQTDVSNGNKKVGRPIVVVLQYYCIPCMYR